MTVLATAVAHAVTTTMNAATPCTKALTPAMRSARSKNGPAENAGPATGKVPLGKGRPINSVQPFSFQSGGIALRTLFQVNKFNALRRLYRQNGANADPA